MPDDDRAELRDLAAVFGGAAEDFVGTVTDVASGASPEAAIPLLLLGLSDVLAAGARLGAITDIVPDERFEPDTGVVADAGPLATALANVLEGIDDYYEVEDPVLAPDVVSSSLSTDLALIVDSLRQGLDHYGAGNVVEALWWWQFSYLANWGERASAAVRVLQVILAHLRLDVDDDVAAEATFEALHAEDDG